ncbi:MAG: transketolase [Bacteroidota bacterium]
MTATDTLHTLAANTIRGLTIDAVEAAQSGHPGMPMGMADAAVVLWTKYLKFDPTQPDWFDRDRFILSAGHGSMLIYSLLHLAGYDLPMEELKNFRQWESRTPGHPENTHTKGVETTTGPLGQGIANAVGFALAERHLAAVFNTDEHTIVDHYTYVFASDGDLMEGVAYEACSLAGHWKLGKLIVYYDDNDVTIDGHTDLAFTEDVLKRFEAQGWHTQRIDGHDVDALVSATDAARAETDRPSIISCRTIIGYGVPDEEGTHSVHSDPLGEEKVRATKERLGIPLEPTFHVPAEVYDYMRAAGGTGADARQRWDDTWAAYAEAHPDKYALLSAALQHDLPAGWDAQLPAFEPGSKPLATRAASGKVIDALKQAVPTLVGGSGDLTPSNKTMASDDVDFQAFEARGEYFRFGVREHGMGAILNGLNLHGGLRGYGGTFLIFSDYMRPTIRLAALAKAPTLFVYTHDSVGLGEDGPTHQPIEQIASLRAVPHLNVYRPADANETVACWKQMVTDPMPSVIALSRQGLPVLEANPDGVARGAYVVSEAGNGDPAGIVLATGSEVHIALDAQKQLAEAGVHVRVVSMPCWELFDQQPEAYKDEVLPGSVTARVSIEAGASLGWHRWTGPRGVVIAVDRFGASAPYKAIYEHYGLTADAITDAMRSLVG